VSNIDRSSAIELDVSPSANRREGCNTPLVPGQREPLDGADAATMTLDHLGAKMRCDKCGKWPVAYKV